jgi:chorismate mutase
MNVAEKIGRIKSENDVRILQEVRWEDIVERALSSSQKLGLSEEFLRTVLDAIHIESIERQKRVMNELQGSK